MGNRKSVGTLLMVLMLTMALLMQSTAAMAKGNGQQKGKGHGRQTIIINFNDTEDAAWALECINKLKVRNVINGYPDGSFRPNQSVSRLEAIVMAVRMMGLEDEAEDKEADLHFKDAKLIEQKYEWAEGYIAVALEEGLFDAAEDRVQPDAAASRVWAASLLVRALGLEEEALERMTDIPDFKDAKQIPAASIGYVNVAVDEDLIDGYPDNTFKPNKTITRAEFATLLDRTDDDWDEIIGATTVKGEIESIKFDSDDDEVGTITIETAQGTDYSYKIEADLAVEYDGDYIEADELVVGDLVRLVVKDGRVKEATLLEEADEDEDGYQGITEFNVELVADDDITLDLTYQNEDGKVVATVERVNSHNEINYTGTKAIDYVENLLERMDLDDSMSNDRIVEETLEVIGIDEDDVEELKLELEFTSGKDVNIDMDSEDFDD